MVCHNGGSPNIERECEANEIENKGEKR